MDTPCHPPAEGRSGPAIPCRKEHWTSGDDHVLALRGDAGQVGSRPVGERVIRRGEAALDLSSGTDCTFVVLFARAGRPWTRSQAY